MKKETLNAMLKQGAKTTTSVVEALMEQAARQPSSAFVVVGDAGDLSPAPKVDKSSPNARGKSVILWNGGRFPIAGEAKNLAPNELKTAIAEFGLVILRLDKPQEGSSVPAGTHFFSVPRPSSEALDLEDVL